MILVIVAFACLATLAFVASVAVLFGQRQARMERRLAGYTMTHVPDAKAEKGSATAPETQVVQQAVELTGRLVERAGLLAKIEHALEQGDVPIRASELVFYTIAAVVTLLLLGSVLFGVVAGIIIAALTGIAPFGYVLYRKQERVRRFERQLPDTLTLLASSLRAGFSFMQGLEAVAQEAGEPMRRELQRVFTEVRLGRAPEDALGDAAERMGSRDLAWTVMAIKIQREVGGNLATLLDTVADTMQKRERMRREVRSLTAEGRLSAIVLALIPPVLAVLIWLRAPDYIETLFHHTIGWVAVITAGVLAVLGWFWLRKLIEIEV